MTDPVRAGGQQGYDTVVCNVDAPGQLDHNLTTLTSRYRVDGVMVVSLWLSRQWLASFWRAEVPLVAIDVTLAEHREAAWVQADGGPCPRWKRRARTGSPRGGKYLASRPVTWSPGR